MAYKTPQPPVHCFPDPRQQDFVRRLYERLESLERITNSESVTEGNAAPKPAQSGLKVTVNPNVPGHFFVRIVNPEFLLSDRNRHRAAIRHWLEASPSAQFNGNVTDFGISHQTHYTITELGKGTFHFRMRSTADGRTFNDPVHSGAVTA